MNKVIEVFQKKKVCNNTTLKEYSFIVKGNMGTLIAQNPLIITLKPLNIQIFVCDMKNFPHYVFHFVNRNSLI